VYVLCTACVQPVATRRAADHSTYAWGGRHGGFCDDAGDCMLRPLSSPNVDLVSNTDEVVPRYLQHLRAFTALTRISVSRGRR
jgi:hypothetical protein